MPRKVDLEAKLLADKERLKEAAHKLRDQSAQTDRQIAQERYRKQRAWEAQVGRLAWLAGLNTLDLGTIAHLLNQLTPADLAGVPAPTSQEDSLAVLG